MQIKSQDAIWTILKLKSPDCSSLSFNEVWNKIETWDRWSDKNAICILKTNVFTHAIFSLCFEKWDRKVGKICVRDDVVSKVKLWWWRWEFLTANFRLAAVKVWLCAKKVGKYNEPACQT